MAHRNAILGAICALGLASGAQAAHVTYTYLATPSLVGLAPLDAYWGNGNDVPVPGENRIGSTNAYGGTVGPSGYFFYGFMQGTFTLSAHVSTGGELQYLALSDTGEQSNYFAPGVPDFINAPVGNELVPEAANGVSVNPVSQTYSSVFSLISPQGDVSSYAGTGAYLHHGQDAAIVFAGNDDLIATFNFLVPLLPTNWVDAVFDSGHYTVTAGPVAPFGVNGSLSYFAYSVPIPPSLGLFALGLGLIARRRSAQTPNTRQ